MDFLVIYGLIANMQNEMKNTLTTRNLNAPTGSLALLIVLCRCKGICRQTHRRHSTAENKRFL